MRKDNTKSFKNQKGMLVKLMKLFRIFDLFGKNINLTYNGSDKFKTSWGGMASIILLSFLVAYVIYLLNSLISKSNPRISKATLLKDIKSKSDDYYRYLNIIDNLIYLN